MIIIRAVENIHNVKIIPVNTCSDFVSDTFGQLKIADSTRKQYVKANDLSSRKLREFLSVRL